MVQMGISSPKHEIVEFVRGAYQEGFIPTVRELLDRFQLSRDAFYGTFPGGLKEVCRKAAVPVPKERYQAVAKASAAKRKATRQSRKGTLSGAAHLDKVVFADLHRGVHPVQIVEKHGNAKRVLQLAREFIEAQHLTRGANPEFENVQLKATVAALASNKPTSSQTDTTTTKTSNGGPETWSSWEYEVHGPTLLVDFTPYLGCTIYATENGQVVKWKTVTPEYVQYLVGI